MALTTAEVIVDTSNRAEHTHVLEAFKNLGFDVGPVGPRSFSISAPTDIFERTFEVKDLSGPAPPAELPVTALPADIRTHVRRIVFTRNYTPFGP